MRTRHTLRHTPHTVRGPIESSTEGPRGCGVPSPFRHTTHTVPGPIGSFTKGPNGCVNLSLAPTLAHPSH
eukprot:4416308-Pyramimonas_sp.AAC.1